MKFNDNPIMVLVGIVLIGVGIFSFLGFRFIPSNLNTQIAVFVLALLLIILVLAGKVKENTGVVITALWLILMGLIAYFNLKFDYSDLILSSLPIGAGFFMFMGI
jgi:hypothetical protein